MLNLFLTTEQLPETVGLKVRRDDREISRTHSLIAGSNAGTVWGTEKRERRACDVGGTSVSKKYNTHVSYTPSVHGLDKPDFNIQ